MKYRQKRRFRARYTGMIVAVMIGAVGALNYMRPLPITTAAAAGLTTSLGTPTLQWPIAGQAAIGASGYGVLATNGRQIATPTASVAKIITALAVLKAKPLDVNEQGPDITITDNDVAIYNKYLAEQGSVAKVAAGERLTEYQALQAMLLPSANNVADTLAIWAFGSLSAYQNYATQLVAGLGLTHTTIGSDASGFAPDTTSTATDLVRLGAKAMENPVVAQVVGQRSAVLPVAGNVGNANSMLDTNGIVGIKVGNNDQDRGAFLFAAKHSFANGQTVMIIGAIMGQGNLRAALDAAQTLLASAVPAFGVTTPVSAGQVLATYTTAWGKTASAVAERSLSVAAWQGAVTLPHLDLKTQGVVDNTQVGMVSLTAGANAVSSPVVLTHAISAPSFWWRLLRR